VKLSNFEGPLDLLLHLIKKTSWNPRHSDALITAQYLEAIALMEELDLDVAGEYIVMAAHAITSSRRCCAQAGDAAGVEAKKWIRATRW